jgi:hypothetical protein
MIGWTVIGVVLLRVVWCSVAAIYLALTEVSGKPTPTESITAGKLLRLSRIMSLVSSVTRRALSPP